MYAQIATYVLDGLCPRKVEVEVALAEGPPGLRIAGFPDYRTAAVCRIVRGAIEASGFKLPDRPITVWLAAETAWATEGPGLSFAIAAGILSASGQVPSDPLRGVAFAGTLEREGTIGPVLGALQIAAAVAEDPDLDSLAIASASSPEAACASGVEVLKVFTLGAVRYLGDEDRERLHPEPRALPSEPDPGGPDFADIRGRLHFRRAAEIAVAGDHNLLLSAPRGSGQGFLVRRIPSILPPLRRPEALEVLRIASASEDQSSSAKTGRPFRAPHLTLGGEEMLGRQRPPLPGEVTRAHNGVLFLEGIAPLHPASFDRLCEARRSGVTLIGSTRCAPSAFFLVASVHPCPCGNLGVEDRDCTCEQAALVPYQRWLQDATQRFEVVAAYGPPSREDHAGSPGEPSSAVRARVVEARARQEARLGQGRTNRKMSLNEVEDCGLTSQAVHRINRTFPYPSQVGRRIQIAKVARTIADLAGAEKVDTFHLAEATDLQGFVPDSGTVRCTLCGTEVPAISAHLHQGRWIGETCCRDE